MIKIIITDVDQTIKNQKGQLAALGVKMARGFGLIDPLSFIEEKMAQKIRETLDKEGIIAKVEVSSN